MNVFRKLTDFQIFRIITVISLLNMACLPSAMVGDKDNLDKLITFAGAALLLPGLSDVPRDNDGKAIVPDDKTYLRVKLQDDPIPPPENKGLVHFIIDYEEISRNIYVSGDGNKEESKQFDFFTLTVENIEVKPVGKDKILLPAPIKLVKIFEKNKKYSAVFNNLRLEVGEYEYLRVNLYELHGNAGNNKGKENVFHQVQVEGTAYPLNFIKKRIQFMDAFRIEKGKLTTLHSKPTQPKVIHYQKNNSEYRSQVEFNAKGYNVNFPIDKIWINMKSISVTKSSGEVILLNDMPFRFDLLSLRGTAVLLVGNDMVPAGTYNHFTINLDDGNSIELEYESKPLLITNEYTKTFNVPGPFDLRGGRMTEIILDFDPNLSVFNTLDSGYVMEPTIKVVSILSMTPEQDIRVQQALGEYANAVIKEADVIFQGSVNSLNYIVANNIYNKPMIYTDMSLKVEDRLRGEIENPDNFPFRMIGGSVGNKSLDVKGMPEFSKSEIFLLFLKKENENYSVVSGEKGKVSINGSVELKTDKTKWDGLSPIVKVFVNPNISTISSENYLSNIKQSILQWFQKGKSNFGFLYDNITSNDKPTSAESIDCNISSLIGSKITTVYPVNMYDKDCTDTSCVFLWKCNQYILSSDIQINTHNYKWTLHQPTQIDEYSLPHEILHNLGHVAGLEHCKVGDTISMCNSRLSTNQIEPISTDVMYKFSNNIVSISENDIGQLQSLYGVLNLPFQQEGKYVLDEDDILNILSMMDMENIAGLGSIEGRKKAGEYLIALTNYNQKRTGKNVSTQYDEFVNKVKSQINSFDVNDLKIQKKLLTTGIYTAHKRKEDVVNGYFNFDLSFIEYTIQKHLELRQLTIDVIGELQ